MVALADTIKLFSQGMAPAGDGQYLSSYVDALQRLKPAAFTMSDPNKDVLIHVMELL